MLPEEIETSVMLPVIVTGCVVRYTWSRAS